MAWDIDRTPQVLHKTFLLALSCLSTFKKEIKREERDTPVVLPHVLLARSVVPRHILYTMYQLLYCKYALLP